MAPPRSPCGLGKGLGLLVIAEPELLAAHQPSVDLALRLHSRVDRLGSPEFPYLPGGYDHLGSEVSEQLERVTTSIEDSCVVEIAVAEGYLHC